MRRALVLLPLAIGACGGSTASPAEAPRAAAPASSTRAAPIAPSCPSGAVRIEGGRYAESEHGREVAVSALCAGAHEVTVDEYAGCVAAGRCAPAFDTAAWPLAEASAEAIASEACNVRHPERRDHPINCVDWSQARSYCAFAGMRLPTDQEWEWLARGGARGLSYPWGDEPPTSERACAGRDATCPARAAAGVIVDLVGNVWEWTSSFADGERQRSFRGGGFSTPLDALGHFPRSAFPETARTEVIGVRCVVSLSVSFTARPTGVSSP